MPFSAMERRRKGDLQNILRDMILENHCSIRTRITRTTAYPTQTYEKLVHLTQGKTPMPALCAFDIDTSVAAHTVLQTDPMRQNCYWWSHWDLGDEDLLPWAMNTVPEVVV